MGSIKISQRVSTGDGGHEGRKLSNGGQRRRRLAWTCRRALGPIKRMAEAKRTNF
jgi:hypothetical protein